LCRNIRPLFNFDPPASQQELQQAALQFVRKISGYRQPSKANQAAFQAAVDDITQAAERLLAALQTSTPPKNRPVEAAKAQARRTNQSPKRT
jgi:hypothetical protein